MVSVSFGFHIFCYPLNICFVIVSFFVATVICQKLHYTSCNKELTLKLTEHIRRHLWTIYCHQYMMPLNTSASSFLNILRMRSLQSYHVWKLPKYCLVGNRFPGELLHISFYKRKQLVQMNSERSQHRTFDMIVGPLFFIIYIHDHSWGIAWITFFSL